jgi:hypothetical protein
MTWTSNDLAGRGLRITGGTEKHIYKTAFLLAFWAIMSYNACADSFRPAWNPDNQDRIYPNALFGISLWVGLYLSPVPTTPMPGRAFPFLVMPRPKTHIALYGGVGMKRGYCRRCQTHAFVIDDRLKCCGMLFLDEAQAIKRICLPDGSRFLAKKSKQQILEQQDYRCAYCWKAFGSVVYRNGKDIILRVNYDHQVPYSYVHETQAYNILAACHVCNALKKDNVFQTIDDCALFLLDRRAEKGYSW